MTAAEAVAQVGRALREASLAEASPEWMLSYRRRCAAADERVMFAAWMALDARPGAMDALREALFAREEIRNELARRVR